MTVYLELGEVKGKSRIFLASPYDPQVVIGCKSVSGGRWSPELRVWHYPLSLTVCKLLRQTFPELRIGPLLTTWARAEVVKRVAISDFHISSSAEPIQLEHVPVVAPTMWNAMTQRGYQTVVPAFAKAVGSHFNGSQPGTGKTIELLATLVECQLAGNVLVIAPKKALRATWGPEINKWLAPDVKVEVHTVDSEEGSIPEREELLVELLNGQKRDARFNFILINPEMLRWEFTCADPECNGKKKTCRKRESHSKSAQHPSLFGIRWDAIVFDETHRITMNANKLSANVSGWGYGAQKLALADNGMKVGMSGTPFKGKPRRFWTMLNWLRPDLYPGQGKWTSQYFEIDNSNPFAAYGTPTDRMLPERVQMFNDDLSQIMIRHTKRELRAINPLWAPPEKVHANIILAMEPKQRRAYESMVKEASARLEGGTLMATGVLAELTRLKQLASAYGTMRNGYSPSLPSCKWDWIVEALEERGLARSLNDGNVKTVIASQFVALLDVYAAELDRTGIKYFMIAGRTKNVEEIQARWQSDQTDTRVLLLSTQAGGVSLTLDAADDLILVDETFVPDDQEQVEDRVHRTSRTDHQVTIYHLITAGTIDETIATDNLFADIEQKKVLDGRRGVAFARKLLDASRIGV